MEGGGYFINIICFSDILWDSLWQRHQHILTRLPRSWKILFIEPTSILMLLKEPSRIIPRIYNNITIISLPVIPLIDRIGMTRRINDYLIYMWIFINLKLLQMDSTVLLYYEPRFSSLIGSFNEKMVIYDCVDDRLAFSSVPRWIGAYIDFLVKRSDIIFVTSHNLFKLIRNKKSEDVYLIGNGVDVYHFRKALDDIPIPKDMEGLKRPILGYIGMIDDWMNFNLIKKISETYPHSSIILLGPVNSSVQKRIQELKYFTNIHLIGKRPYEVLPSYLKAFDVALIPFTINELTKSVNPLKLYEYLASGKKIISTDLPEVRRYEDIIYIARDEEEFISFIYKALHDTCQNSIKNGLIIAEENSWGSKTMEIREILLNKYKSIL